MQDETTNDYTLKKLNHLSRLEEETKNKYEDGDTLTKANKELLRMEEMRLKQIESSVNARKSEYEEEQLRLERRRAEVLKQRDVIQSERESLTESIHLTTKEHKTITDSVDKTDEQLIRDKALLERNNELLKNIELQLQEQETDMERLQIQEETFLKDYKKRENSIQQKKLALEKEEINRIKTYEEQISQIQEERVKIEEKIQLEEEKMEMALTKQSKAMNRAKEKNIEIEGFIRAELERQEELKEEAEKVKQMSIDIDNFNKQTRTMIQNKEVTQKKEFVEQEKEPIIRSTEDEHNRVLNKNDAAYTEEPKRGLEEPGDEVARLDTMPGGIANFLKDRNELIDRGDYLDEQEELYYEKEKEHSTGLFGKLKNIFK